MASGLQFETALKEVVADERTSAVERLTSGLEDHSTYREEVGYIRALDQFAVWCAEVAKMLDER